MPNRVTAVSETAGCARISFASRLPAAAAEARRAPLAVSDTCACFPQVMAPSGRFSHDEETPSTHTPPSRVSARQMKRSLLTDQDVGGTEVSPSAAGSDAQEFGAETAEAVVDMESLLSATDEETGLSEDVATERLREFGRNELPDIRVPKWKVFVSHFTGIMPCMIILAITLEGLLQEWPDFCTLLTLLILNGSIGFWEDMRAGDAVAALKASLKPEATVKRDGVWRKIDASLLVPGDLVGLGAGRDGAGGGQGWGRRRAGMGQGGV